MATANSLIKGALRLLQVKEANEPISAAEGQDGLDALNELIDSWSNEDLMQHFRKEHSINYVSGQETYTVGVGGDFNVTRFLSIENAFTRDNGESDWEIIEINNDQYQRIILKETESSYPRYFFYRPDFPLGEISVWPSPGESLEFHINVRTQLTQYTDINTNLDFPPGYSRALRYNLAVEIAPEYKMNISPLIMKQAISSKEYIKDTNNKNIPELESPLLWRYGYGDTLARFGTTGGAGGGPALGDIIEQGTNTDTITELGSNVDTITEDGIT